MPREGHQRWEENVKKKMFFFFKFLKGYYHQWLEQETLYETMKRRTKMQLKRKRVLILKRDGEGGREKPELVKVE